MILIKQKPDTFGAFASLLCLIHCIATPFLFIAQTCSATCCHDAPLWWQFIDYLFLIISFFAIYQTTKKTSSSWIKPALWLSWFVLLIIILNEKLEWMSLNYWLVYIPAFALIVLHLYNRKYCQCDTDDCSIHEE